MTGRQQCDTCAEPAVAYVDDLFVCVKHAPADAVVRS